MGDGLTIPGWPAEWLNGWMAALGVACRSDLLVSFTVEASPRPVLHRPDGTAPDPAQVAALLPSATEMDKMPLARPAAEDRGELPRNPTVAQWHSRTALARAAGDLVLGATMTDLAGDGSDLVHSPFDATVPKGLTLWQRVQACLSKLDWPLEQVRASLEGTARRHKLNGLGFDARRVAISSATDTEKYVDPVVELFAFCSLPLFPVRGHGGATASTRGWQLSQSRRSAFTWPVWSRALSRPAIDALLDEVYNNRPSALDPSGLRRWKQATADLEVFGCFGSVAFRAAGSSDTTRAYSGEELWMTT